MPDDTLHLLPARPGRVRFSLEGLRERVERQFEEETAHRADILFELHDDTERRWLIGEVADYVLATEAVTLSDRDRRTLIDQVLRNLFGFGPLQDELSRDDAAGIVIEGPEALWVERYEAAALRREPLPDTFDDEEHLARVLERMLAGAGVDLAAGTPFVEVGAVLRGRPARITLIGPPLHPAYRAAIRLHPAARRGLEAELPSEAARLLRTIVGSYAGLLIVGEPGAGKTTIAGSLLAALLETLPIADIATAERAAELPLPAGRQRHIADPTDPDPGAAFAKAIHAAVAESAGWLVLDEVRGDEPSGLWDALQEAASRSLLLVARGGSLPRVRRALSMTVRREHPTLPQVEIDAALDRRLPYALVLGPGPDGATAHLYAWEGAAPRAMAAWRGAEGFIPHTPPGDLAP